MKSKSPYSSRRKLSAVVRKATASYYTAEEQQEIAQAAKREGISMSSFIATTCTSRSPPRKTENTEVNRSVDYIRRSQPNHFLSVLYMYNVH